MTCIKTQSMITPFINDKLGIKEMDEFLEHVNSCKNCREELEFYYALLTAMKQLDEDKELSGNFEQELSEKLVKAHEKVVHARYTYYRKKTILILTMILLAIVIGIGYADKIRMKKSNVSDSIYRLRYQFHYGQYGLPDIQLQNYLMEHGIERIPMEE